jgi:hypothetical protein
MRLSKTNLNDIVNAISMRLSIRNLNETLKKQFEWYCLNKFEWDCQKNMNDIVENNLNETVKKQFEWPSKKQFE